MDRFSWTTHTFGPDERLVIKQQGIRIYDGEQKTAFDHGELSLTTHRLIWKDQRDQKCIIGVSMSLVVLVEEQAATFTKSAKLCVYLQAVERNKPPGPVSSSPSNSVKFSFKEGGHIDFLKHLSNTLKTKSWEKKVELPTSTMADRKFHSGIVGIERTMQQKQQATDRDITQAFSDLSQLMDKAKEMVSLSRMISAKIKDKQGEITEDETIQFKSYLLSLGIDDPVTRLTHGAGLKYFQELAKEISRTMDKVLQDCGGVMTLTDAYCRLNRARGMELLSPEDLLSACQLMADLNLPVRMHTFESGVIVLQLLSHREEAVIKSTLQLIEVQGSLTAEELSKSVNVSVILAKERLLLSERHGKICRDETVEGLRFYPNRFLTEMT